MFAFQVLHILYDLAFYFSTDETETQKMLCLNIIQFIGLFAEAVVYHIQRKVYLGYEKACCCCIGVLLLEDQFSLFP